MTKKKNIRYMAMWCSEGLECIFNVDLHMKELDAWEKNKIVAVLKGDPIPKQPEEIPLRAMLLRARFNLQRKYEIYEFNSTMSEVSIRREFDIDPQPLVDYIRTNGYKVYSDYVKSSKVRIT